MTNKFARLALSAVAASLLALPAFAQSAEWRVDSNHSSARIAVKSDTPGESSISLGAAAATGILRVDSSNPANSAFEFDLSPAGADAHTATDDPIRATHISFRSVKASLTTDGKLKLTGALTVSRVIRDVRLEANEAYSGPVETALVVVRSTREESLILPIPAAENNGRAGSFAEVSTTLNIPAEEFPELVDELLATNWPAKAQDNNCETSAASEGYSGTLCTGTAVESRSATRTASSFSEDYAGGEPISVQPANGVTLALHLRLAPQSVQVSTKVGQ